MKTGEIKKKTWLFPFFSPWKVAPMPIPRPRFHSKPPPLPPGARCGRAGPGGPGGPGASHEERTQPPKTWGFHQKWWCAIWLFNSSPWKMAHRNRWFTELKNGWIFHGYVKSNGIMGINDGIMGIKWVYLLWNICDPGIIVANRVENKSLRWTSSINATRCCAPVINWLKNNLQVTENSYTCIQVYPPQTMIWLYYCIL